MVQDYGKQVRRRVTRITRGEVKNVPAASNGDVNTKRSIQKTKKTGSRVKKGRTANF
jgi:hypothetical protein